MSFVKLEDSLIDSSDSNTTEFNDLPEKSSPSNTRLWRRKYYLTLVLFDLLLVISILLICVGLGDEISTSIPWIFIGPCLVSALLAHTINIPKGRALALMSLVLCCLIAIALIYPTVIFLADCSYETQYCPEYTYIGMGMLGILFSHALLFGLSIAVLRARRVEKRDSF